LIERRDDYVDEEERTHKKRREKDRGRRRKTWEKIFYEIFREDLV